MRPYTVAVGWTPAPGVSCPGGVSYERGEAAGWAGWAYNRGWGCLEARVVFAGLPDGAQD